MLEHGGRLRAAAQHHRIPLADWIDLSTGINPRGFSVPALPAECWQRLPEDGDGLEAAAGAYYGSGALLPLPGSQAAIMGLPALFPAGPVAFVAPLYREHPHAWAKRGHRCLECPTLDQALATRAPVVVLCNPNNPTAEVRRREALLDAAEVLRRQGGWLLVDEAFADAEPGDSLVPLAGSGATENLVVLRSLGKFFGLAGARVGFAFAAPELLCRLAEVLGPWALSGPARHAARLALCDTAWQRETRGRLEADRSRLTELLEPLGPVRATRLFATLELGRGLELEHAHAHAHALADFLARRAILVRRFESLPLLRFGLPGGEAGWQRLAVSLDEWRST